MKRYVYATAYLVVAGFLLATLLVMIPNIVMDVLQGKMGFGDVVQTIVLIPFVAGAAGCMLAGLPVVLTGVCMALFNRLPLILFLVATVVTAVILELGYCYLLHIKEHFIPTILTLTAITILCLSLVWRFWLDRRLDQLCESNKLF